MVKQNYGWGLKLKLSPYLLDTHSFSSSPSSLSKPLLSLLFALFLYLGRGAESHQYSLHSSCSVALHCFLSLWGSVVLFSTVCEPAFPVCLLPSNTNTHTHTRMHAADRLLRLVHLPETPPDKSQHETSIRPLCWGGGSYKEKASAALWFIWGFFEAASEHSN